MVLNIRIVVAIGMLLSGNAVYSDVNCGTAKINQVLIYNNKITVVHGNKYRGLGHTATAQNQQQKLSVVLTAKASGADVEMRYPDGYDCESNNYGADPTLVIIK